MNIDCTVRKSIEKISIADDTAKKLMSGGFSAYRVLAPRKRKNAG